MIKKVLIVSDSHGKSSNVKIAIDREYPDMLIHLGDIEDEPDKIRRWLDEAAEKYNSHLTSKDSESRISLPVPAIFIQGNCDRYGDYKKELKQVSVFELNGHKFFCSHGHIQGVNMGLTNLMYTALENDCDIAMYGHTHVPFDESFGEEEENRVRILNPGSISLPRGGRRKSYMVMTFFEEGFEVELKEL